MDAQSYREESKPFWSTVQGINTLYYSRLLRFSEKTREEYRRKLNLEKAESILEIGCGPGALAKRLREWYPDKQIAGLDRDRGFLSFAKAHVKDVLFLEGDAEALPFADHQFGATISYTVQEHIDPEVFLGEQFRVLEEGGVCVVISCRPGSGTERKADCVAWESPREQAIWAKGSDRFRRQLTEKNVGAYCLNEKELPLAMERAGFSHISTAYVVTDQTPDHPGNSKEEAIAMIEEERLSALDSAANLRRIAGDLVSEEDLRFLEKEIGRKYDERLRLYRDGIRQWDCKVVLNMIVRGEKHQNA